MTNFFAGVLRYFYVIFKNGRESIGNFYFLRGFSSTFPGDALLGHSHELMFGREVRLELALSSR
jgi:hypothetical protein